MGCSSAKPGSFRLNRTSWIERDAWARRGARGGRGESTLGAWGGGGVAVGVSTLGGGVGHVEAAVVVECGANVEALVAV